MSQPGKAYVAFRGERLRAEDRQLLDHLFRHSRLADVGRTILSELNLESLFGLIVEQTTELLGAECCTVFVHDEQTNQLWSIVGTGLEKMTIRIPADVGIAGWVFSRQEPLLINDAYSDPRFCRDVDKTTGLVTRNILCIPLINRSGMCIGSLEALNKKDGDFTDKDGLLLSTVSQYIAIALENGRLYEGLKEINETRKKAIDHLSHELRTPVAIIDAALAVIARKLEEKGLDELDKPLARCQRNLKRLLSMQEKISDILNQGFGQDRHQLTRLIETALCLAEEIAEGPSASQAVVAQRLQQRLASIYRQEDHRFEEIVLDKLLEEICDRAVAAARTRMFSLIRRIEPGLTLVFDARVIEKACAGLLKNAIEATPDGGMVMVAAAKEEQKIAIEIQDWGVGISPENQRNLFSGFFHTQDTAFYASKQPYAFGAGGSGADLLRIKVLSERLGFAIGFVSRCCDHLSQTEPRCPGAIASCAPIKSLADCMASGGSTFSLHLPLTQPMASGRPCHSRKPVDPSLPA